MSIRASQSARVEQLLLDMGRGLDHNVLIELHGADIWNDSLLLAAARVAQTDPVLDIPQDILLGALAHPLTDYSTRAQALVHRAWRISMEGGFAKKFAITALAWMKSNNVDLDSVLAEQAWLELGKRHSKQAKDPNYHGLAWTQVDAADHILSATEPYVGVALELRKWACSNDCALPNTLLAFRRGQLKIDAAIARGELIIPPEKLPKI